MTQSTKYAIVTGVSEGGIGYYVVRDLAQQGYHVTLASRNADKTQKVIQQLVSQHHIDKSLLEFIQIDTADLTSVQKFVQQYLQSGNPLHLLILNAGIYKGPRSPQGFEGAFACMYLGHWYLTQQLMPLMKKSQPARVIWVSSAMHRFGHLDYQKFAYNARYSTYGDVKLAMVLAARSWHRKTSSEGVSHLAMHPGAVASAFYKSDKWGSIGGFLQSFTSMLGKLVWITPEESSRAIVFGATKQRVDQVEAVYLQPHQPVFSWFTPFMTEMLAGRFLQHPTPVEPSTNALNDKVGAQLFTWTEQKLDEVGFGGQQSATSSKK